MSILKTIILFFTIFYSINCLGQGYFKFRLANNTNEIMYVYLPGNKAEKLLPQNISKYSKIKLGTPFWWTIKPQDSLNIYTCGFTESGTVGIPTLKNQKYTVEICKGKFTYFFKTRFGSNKHPGLNCDIFPDGTLSKNMKE